MSEFADTDFDIINHDDYVLLCRDDRFGGFEEVKHKREAFNHGAPGTFIVRYFRKSIAPGNFGEVLDALQMENHVMKGRTFSTSYPLYSTPDGRKWAFISVIEDCAAGPKQGNRTY